MQTADVGKAHVYADTHAFLEVDGFAETDTHVRTYGLETIIGVHVDNTVRVCGDAEDFLVTVGLGKRGIGRGSCLKQMGGEIYDETAGDMEAGSPDGEEIYQEPKFVGV